MGRKKISIEYIKDDRARQVRQWPSLHYIRSAFEMQSALPRADARAFYRRRRPSLVFPSFFLFLTIRPRGPLRLEKKGRG